MPDPVRWHCFEDADAVAGEALARILSASRRAIAARGRFSMVLAGGSTPERAYCLLKDSDTDWSRWFIWFGDERCLPVDHPDRNSVMADRAWLSHVQIPHEQIFSIPAELGPQKAAEIYESRLKSGTPFDLVLLGMGEDGHTASLFPNRAYPKDHRVVAVFDAPKPPSERVSLNYSTLCDTREMCVLVTGQAKREAVRQWKQAVELPVTRLACPAGVDVLLDETVCD
ncbi:6-phosphogluconolactonase, eukaryotic type [hydrothermal vent metagenome]|uniref:6-phosphogluconolactonase, eukaryotic type n=1 Tax=hydrothermal vent metagenome TaxID=652676 RepID=A0A3B0Z1D2_9ZZZZ